MSIKQFRNLRDMTLDELASQAKDRENQLFRAKIKLATGQLGDKAILWRLRKEIARIRTIQSQNIRKNASDKQGRGSEVMSG